MRVDLLKIERLASFCYYRPFAVADPGEHNVYDRKAAASTHSHLATSLREDGTAAPQFEIAREVEDGVADWR